MVLNARMNTSNHKLQYMFYYSVFRTVSHWARIVPSGTHPEYTLAGFYVIVEFAIHLRLTYNVTSPW